ncbi:hypothetical protein ABZT26_25775 [Streptomyces sp. NPDC005395]|uniref:hypothetical protein n=1 Tax=Streptomyces sp. NPDC005395 TaxID=3157042 RepID=UPI0033A33B99
MKINRRKAPWYVQALPHLARAVTVSGAWLKRLNSDEPTPFGERHPDLLEQYGDKDAFLHLVLLHMVHEDREVLAELLPDRAEALGYELIRKAAQARTSTDVPARVESAAKAHKAAQESAAERGRELLRSVWPELKQGPAGQLTADSAEFGYWYLWVSDDGARVRAELRGIPRGAWKAFVKRAVDRLHFQQCWPGGAEKAETAPVGEHMADVPYRSEFPDYLELAEDRTAKRLEMRGLELERVAGGLAVMLGMSAR